MSQRPRPRSGWRPPSRREPYPADPIQDDPYATAPVDPSVDPYLFDEGYDEGAVAYDPGAVAYDQSAGAYDEGAVTYDQYGTAYDEYGAVVDEYEEPKYRVINPFRLLLALLIAAAGAVAFYGIVVQPQLPLAVSGLGVMGVALGLLAFSLAGAAAALGRRGRGGRALLAALFGGFCALAGAGALSAAIVLGILAAGTA